MESTTQSANLAEKVAQFKLIARDALRMRLISPRLANVSAYEKQVKQTVADKADYQAALDVQKYEISVMDVNHPNFANDKKFKEEYLAEKTKKLEVFDQQVEELNKKIAEQNENIQKIEKGETLVSLNDLNDLVAQMCEQYALEQVKA
jgi:hypothetical protein